MLADPRYYVHFILWEDLVATTTQALREKGLDVDVPFIEHGPETEWVLCSSLNRSFAWNHHLYVEDEVFEYSVVENWPLPDHYLEDQVVFHVQELDHSNFIRRLAEYWTLWVWNRASNIQRGCRANINLLSERLCNNQAPQ